MDNVNILLREHRNGRCYKVLIVQLCLTLCQPVDCSLLTSFVHGIL